MFRKAVRRLIRIFERCTKDNESSAFDRGVLVCYPHYTRPLLYLQRDCIEAHLLAQIPLWNIAHRAEHCQRADRLRPIERRHIRG